MADQKANESEKQTPMSSARGLFGNQEFSTGSISYSANNAISWLDRDKNISTGYTSSNSNN